jgi:hypothetical protein
MGTPLPNQVRDQLYQAGTKQKHCSRTVGYSFSPQPRTAPSVASQHRPAGDSNAAACRRATTPQQRCGARSHDVRHRHQPAPFRACRCGARSDILALENASRPVSRVLSGSSEAALGDHSSGTTLARRLKQPTRTTGPERADGCPPRRSYSVLLPVGFTVPLPLPVARWALTPPFHPYLPAIRRS